MAIRFSFEEQETYLRSLLWIAIICLPALGWVNDFYFPEAYDPIELRGAISGCCLLVQLGSYAIPMVRKCLRQILYGLILIGIVWINYLLVQNQLSDRYVISLVTVFIGCSLVFQNRLHLQIYMVLFLSATTAGTLMISDPMYPKVAFLFQVYLLGVLVYIALRNLIVSNSRLSLSSQYFKALVDNVDASCCLLDPKMRVVKFNERLRKRLSVETGKELKEGAMFTDYVAKYEIDVFERAFSKAISGEMVHGEKPVYINNRQETWLDLKFIPVPDPNLHRSFVLFHARDIQAIKTSQEKIKKQNEELIQANQELDRFVYMAAHDLRTPLTSLLGLIDLARREKSLDALATYFKMMDESVQKLDRFINEVMNFSKNARTEVSSEKLDFESVIQEILESYQFIEGWDKMTKEVVIEGHESFYSDKQRIEIILNNLISNAWKYHDPDKENPFVKIQVKLESQAARIKIEDNGLGMNPDRLDKIFDLFYRINSKSTGSGLGLFIVQETLDKLKGSIEVESDLNRGSTFKLTIPSLNPEKAEPVKTSVENVPTAINH